MRLDILSGGALAGIAAISVLLGAFFDLELDHVALLGVALGAVVGLVPQGRSVHRLLGFAGGFASAWIGYALRAAALPDSTSGRAVAVLVVVLACLLVHLAARQRVPLWSTLVGVAALVGAYEETYTAAPARFVDQSASAATTVLLAAAVGYLVSALFVPDREPGVAPRRAPEPEALHPIDELMTESAR
jgi:hypothetical protein